MFIKLKNLLAQERAILLVRKSVFLGFFALLGLLVISLFPAVKQHGLGSVLTLEFAFEKIFSPIFGSTIKDVEYLLGQNPLHGTGLFLLVPLLFIASPIGIVTSSLLSCLFLYYRRSLYAIFGLASLIPLVFFYLHPILFIWMIWFLMTFIYLAHRRAFIPTVSPNAKVFFFTPLLVTLMGFFVASYLFIGILFLGFFDFVLFDLSFPTIQQSLKSLRTMKDMQLIIGVYNTKTGEYFVQPPSDQLINIRNIKATLKLTPAPGTPHPQPTDVLRR